MLWRVLFSCFDFLPVQQCCWMHASVTADLPTRCRQCVCTAWSRATWVIQSPFITLPVMCSPQLLLQPLQTPSISREPKFIYRVQRYDKAAKTWLKCAPWCPDNPGPPPTAENAALNQNYIDSLRLLFKAEEENNSVLSHIVFSGRFLRPSGVMGVGVRYSEGSCTSWVGIVPVCLILQVFPSASTSQTCSGGGGRCVCVVQYYNNTRI